MPHTDNLTNPGQTKKFMRVYKTSFFFFSIFFVGHARKQFSAQHTIFTSKTKIIEWILKFWFSLVFLVFRLIKLEFSNYTC